MEELFKILNSIALQTFFVAIVGYLAFKIGQKQNSINEKLGEVQDTTELYATGGVKKEINNKGKVQKEIPTMRIQNIGTRHIYFNKYVFNGKIYELKNQVRPSVYSQAKENYYWIELPTNGDTHVSLEIYFSDIANKKWKTLIIADIENGFWKIKTYKSEKHLNNS